MQLTPHYFSKAIATTKWATVTVRGFSFTILSLTGDTRIMFAFNDETPQYIRAGVPIELPKDKDGNQRYFEKIRFYNPSASTVTVEGITTASVRLGDGGSDPAKMAAVETLITSGNALLTSIKAYMEPLDAGTAVGLTTIAQTGVSETQIVTASANNRRVRIAADTGNAGNVYWGFATGVLAANAPGELYPGDSEIIETATDIYCVSDNGTEQVRAYVLGTA